ncbi:MAG: hypothetical protein GY859_02020 [Desulfobacterales bacterium]|nr:hypothetical protein [Desulfobacterales bacterium]
MSKKNRDTLKNYFRKGSLPSEDNFSDLIDSTLNIIDEGFEKTLDDGMKIYPIGESERYISFFQKAVPKSPLWSFDVDSKTRNLEIRNSRKEPVVSIRQGRETGLNKVGINKNDPRYTLDVEGVIAGRGRIGTFKQGKVPADGRWQDMLSDLTGCTAFEVVAGVGRKNSGQYSLLHAIALNAFNSKKRIKYHTTWYGARCDRLKLKWTSTAKNKYSLQIRTCCDYDQFARIQYHVASLWADPFMDNCLASEVGESPLK